MSRCVLCAVILCGAAGCADVERLSPRPDELIVLDGATEVSEATQSNGVLELNYRIESPYPAEEITTAIRTLFKGGKWLPLTDDWLNPGNPSGYVRGWSSFVDGTKTPNTIVHTWSAEWKNENNDLVIYRLRFDSEVPSDVPFLQRPDNTTLRVTAAFVPVRVVTTLRAETDQPMR